ncbi:MAG: carbon starvation CstA family protein [Duodenibacillus massiliensis]
MGGPVIPFIFITIACGALSGFHAAIGTGTTPKMIANEKDVLFVGSRRDAHRGFCRRDGFLIAACVSGVVDDFARSIEAVAEVAEFSA